MNWFQKNFRTIIYISFLVPILTVAFVSISHVTAWYGITNPVSWAIYLSVGIEIAALSALAAISAQMGRKVYFPFGIVTFIQFLGNIFFAYQFIDVNSESFRDWVDLVDPIVSFIGVESGDFISHKRFLALFAGGMLPIISLSFLHMLVKFEEDEKNKIDKQEEPKQEEPKQEEPKQEEPKQEEPKQEEPKQEEPKQEEPKQEEPKQEEEVAESQFNPTDEDLKKLEMMLNDLSDSKFNSVGVENDGTIKSEDGKLLEFVETPKINRLVYTKRDA